MFPLAVSGTRQAGPDVPALRNSRLDPPGKDVRQCPALANVLQRQQVLANRAEVGELELGLVVWPVLQHLLIAAGSVGREPLAVDDLRRAALGEGMVREVLEHLGLAVDT